MPISYTTGVWVQGKRPATSNQRPAPEAMSFEPEKSGWVDLNRRYPPSLCPCLCRSVSVGATADERRPEFGMVQAAGIEPAISTSRMWRVTKLPYARTVVPAGGVAPPSPVCRTGVFLLDEAGEKWTRKDLHLHEVAPPVSETGASSSSATGP